MCVRGSMAKTGVTRGITRLYQGGYTCAVGTAKADDGANAVVMAALITATIFFSLTAFTMQSKIDFSFLGAGLGVSLLILCLFGLGMMIFGATPSLYYGYCVGGTLIFALYIIFGMLLALMPMSPMSSFPLLNHARPAAASRCYVICALECLRPCITG